MGSSIIGWDIGGSNVKAARIDEGDTRASVIERAFPIWRDPRRLPSVLAEVAARLGAAEGVDRMAVTMTAELADCFATKREGVGFVIDAVASAFPTTATLVYGVDGRFRSVEVARRRPLQVAASNWMASASWVARWIPHAVVLDVGSTTTDVIPIVGGRVCVRGRMDPTRLRSGELVYTGALRTPVAAIVRSVPLRGRRCRVAAEHFAIAADVYRWLGHIEDEDYACDTPDGRGRTRLEAGARLARMVCADLEMLGAGDVTAIAEHVARAQVRQIASGLRQVKRRLGPMCPSIAVLAGQGAFLARAAAEVVGFRPRALADDLGAAVARVAPAAAVAYLLAEASERLGAAAADDATAGCTPSSTRP